MLTALLALSLMAHAEPPAPSRACAVRGGVPDYMMTHPDRLRVWMDTNSAKIKDIGDAICCMPEEYRKNFIVAPMSHAAQNGQPDSPRVIMLNRIPRVGVAGRLSQPTLNMMMSVNGGSGDLNQAHSLEIMHRNPRSEEAEYFDMEFGRTQGNTGAQAPSRAHLSGRNPQACMTCHGQNGSAPLTGGPKVIFDPDKRWPRFTGGTQTCNRTEDAVMDRIERTAFEAMRTNPRYRCLDVGDDFEKFAAEQRNLLNDVDAQLDAMNRKRVARLIMNTPDWRKFLPAIFARKNCATNLREFASYIPESAWAKMTNVDNVRPSLRNSQNLTETYRSELEGQRRFDDGIREAQRNWLAGPASNISRPPPLSENSVACEHRAGDSGYSPDTERRPGNDFPPKNLSRIESDVSGRRVLDMYKLDTHLEAFRFRSHERGMDSALRFLFESRGISAENWSTDAPGGRYRRRVDIADALAAELPANDPLRRLYETAKQGDEIEPGGNAKCAQLKAMSLRELETIGGPAGASAPAQTRPAITR